MGQAFSTTTFDKKKALSIIPHYRKFRKPNQSKSTHNHLLITTLGLLSALTIVAVVYYGTAFHVSPADDEIEKDDHDDQEEEETRQISPAVLDWLQSKTPNRDFILTEGDDDYEQQQQHKILLVGEGDFSFSAALALSSPSASNMVATSLDSRDFLYRNYQNALKNIDELRRKGCKIIHGIDATEMVQHPAFYGMLFDRIIFNFPHAGFFQAESTESQIRRHQMLIVLFLENAKKMLKEGGEIHVTHKSQGFFQRWNLQVLASNVGLRLIEEVPFNFMDFAGYHTKYGFGGDKNFNCIPSKTYKFGF